MNRTNRYMIVALCAITLLFTLGAQSGTETKTSKKELKFYDVKVQTPEFIGYYTSIKLTPEQEKLKKDVLSAIPAPCCTEYSIATCCCPCNLAKSVWGLSNYAIAKLDYDENKLKEALMGGSSLLTQMDSQETVVLKEDAGLLSLKMVVAV